MQAGYHPAMFPGEISLPIVLALIVGGFGAGFINVVAGGGSLITLPLLIFAGLDPATANATNRIAIFFQNGVATRTFKKRDLYEFKEARSLVLPAVAGAILGSLVVVQLDERWLKGVIAGLIVVMVFFLLFKRSMWEEGDREPRALWVRVLLLFGVGFYGGFIQAGVGLFFVWALVGSAGHDLLKANAYKVLIVLGYTAFSLAIFVGYGLVEPVWGMILAVGNMAGAQVASRTAIKKGNAFLRGALVVMALASAAKLIWDLAQAF
jgi:uncharacterized membrane protein YfcA